LSALDPSCPSELTLKNLIAEIYDHLTGEFALSTERNGSVLSNSMSELAKKILAETSAATRLDLVLLWLSTHGVAIDNGTDCNAKKFFEVFIHHATLIDTRSLSTLNAPVWLWRAGASWLTSIALTRSIRARVTRAEFIEGLVDGRHFEVMHSPRVRTLAALLADALATTEETRAAELVAAR